MGQVGDDKPGVNPVGHTVHGADRTVHGAEVGLKNKRLHKIHRLSVNSRDYAISIPPEGRKCKKNAFPFAWDML